MKLLYSEMEIPNPMDGFENILTWFFAGNEAKTMAKSQPELKIIYSGVN
ncbi:hypothetical protein [Negadavirga shengliensis]|uniref:Uncharacterized protein n=1 Tax=Negadavirga shengliensis TaxID=1389218 RepID=A0ABV9SV99_9BACT